MTVASAGGVPIGAVRLTERYLRSDSAVPARSRRAARSRCRRPVVEARAAARRARRRHRGHRDDAGGGRHLALATYDPDRVTGLRLVRADVDALLERLASMSVAARRAIVGMPSERADVIVAGAAIYAAALARVAAPVMITCDRGIRWGVAHELHSAAP